MTKRHSPLNEQARETTATLLQETLADLVDLSLQTKQAHWNLRGPAFRSLHLQLDEMVEAYRRFSDDVAERKVAVGEPADGRVRTVSEQSKLEAFPAGWIPDEKVVELFRDRLYALSAALRDRIEKVAPHDPITEDLLIGITNTIEEQAWMIQARLPSDER